MFKNLLPGSWKEPARTLGRSALLWCKEDGFGSPEADWPGFCLCSDQFGDGCSSIVRIEVELHGLNAHVRSPWDIIQISTHGFLG